MRLGLWLYYSALFSVAALSAADAGTVAPSKGPGGAEVQIDLPESLHQKNTGGSDGRGLCVYASAKHSGEWANEPVFTGMFDYMRAQPGGSYPSKFNKTVKDYCALKSLPTPLYVQVEGADIELLRLACKTGRMPGVTFSNAGNPLQRYNGQRIPHMVSLVGAGVGSGPDGKGWWVILDNNYVGESNHGWLSEAEFRQTYAPGWAVILLDAGPPPPPKGGKK